MAASAHEGSFYPSQAELLQMYIAAKLHGLKKVRFALVHQVGVVPFIHAPTIAASDFFLQN